jgi:hypothetical protein
VFTSFPNPRQTIQSDRIEKTPKLALVDIFSGCLLCADTPLLETVGKNRESAAFWIKVADF